MADSFEVLEQKVRSAADLVRRLRRENKAFEEELGRLRVKLHEAEKKAAALEAQGRSAAEQTDEADSLQQRIAAAQKESATLRKDAGKLQAQVAELREQVTGFRSQKEEIRSRIARLVEILEGIE